MPELSLVSVTPLRFDFFCPSPPYSPEKADPRMQAADPQQMVYLEAMPQSVMLTDTRLGPGGPRILFVNGAFERMTGWPREAIVGKTPHILQGPQTDRAIFANLSSTLERGETWTGETINYRRDGTAFELAWSISPIRSATGETVQLLAVQEDVTERRTMQRRMVETWQAGELAGQAKSRFLAAMSHELRTPLTAINGYAELMAAAAYGPLGNARYADYAGYILKSGQRLYEVVEALLDAASIQADRLQAADSVVQAGDILRCALDSTQAQAMQRDVCIRVQRLVEVEIYADRHMLAQALLQLMSNAVKFSPEGGVVSLQAGPTKTGGYVFEIADRGPGIPEHALSRLLQPFEQLDMRLARCHEGLGLGLFLAKRLVELNDGSLEFASRESGGTQVRLLLPPGRVNLPNR